MYNNEWSCRSAGITLCCSLVNVLLRDGYQVGISFSLTPRYLTDGCKRANECGLRYNNTILYATIQYI